MIYSANAALLRQRHADYLRRENNALAVAISAHDADHQEAMVQIASTWRLLAEITGREPAILTGN